MHLTMMATAEGDGELITDLAAECSALSKAQMVSVAGLPAAHETRLCRDVSDMVAVSNTTWFWQGQGAFIDAVWLRPHFLWSSGFGAMRFRRLLGWVRLGWLGWHSEGRHPRLEGLFDTLGIGYGQFVLLWQRSVRPECGVIAGCEPIELAQ
jgi:hypothetical protein